MTCPRQWYSWSLHTYGIRQHRLDRRHVQLDHRHIQLALKYLRLGDRSHGYYLQKLIAPYHDDNFNTHRQGSKLPKVLAAQYSVYPKVAVGPDGNLRYLTLSVWVYKKDQEPVSLRAVGDLKICPHLVVFANSYPPLPHSPVESVGRAIETALHAGGSRAEQHYRCLRCPTDYSVQASPDRAELRVWQDLGPEGSPMNPAWRAHVRQLDNLRDPMTYNRFTDGLSVTHEPGSVRRLYNSGDCEAQKFLYSDMRSA
jgi:hypothetical protein